MLSPFVAERTKASIVKLRGQQAMELCRVRTKGREDFQQSSVRNVKRRAFAAGSAQIFASENRDFASQLASDNFLTNPLKHESRRSGGW